MEKIIIFAFVIVLAFCSGGCKSTRNGVFAGSTDYLRPETTTEANYAIRDRIGQLEQEITDARELNRQLTERLERARSEVSAIRESSNTIRELGRRSSQSIQEIIEQMETLAVWIDWATGRIQYLESLLAAEI